MGGWFPMMACRPCDDLLNAMTSTLSVSIQTAETMEPLVFI